MILILEYTPVIVKTLFVLDLVLHTMQLPVRSLEAISLVAIAHLRMEINIKEISADTMMVVSL
jgi:hypothetical protein